MAEVHNSDEESGDDRQIFSEDFSSCNEDYAVNAIKLERRELAKTFSLQVKKKVVKLYDSYKDGEQKADLPLPALVGLLDSMYALVPELLTKIAPSNMNQSIGTELVKIGHFMQQQSIEASMIFLESKTKDERFAHMRDCYTIDEEGVISVTKEDYRPKQKTKGMLIKSLETLAQDIGIEIPTGAYSPTKLYTILSRPKTDEEWEQNQTIRDEGTNAQKPLIHQVNYFQAMVHCEAKHVSDGKDALALKQKAFVEDGWKKEVPTMMASEEEQKNFLDAKKAYCEKQADALKAWCGSHDNAVAQLKGLTKTLHEKIKEFVAKHEEYNKAPVTGKKRSRASGGHSQKKKARRAP